jgi:hypothetical protein
MTFTEYQDYFESILTSETPSTPYDNEDYFNYVKLNQSRQNRWLKQMVLDTKLVGEIKAISKPQHWIIITEPWCGDAAHIVPFLVKIAQINPLIHLEIQLRDSEPFLINSYLTNGGKSIPKLVVRDKEEKDLFIWGPRPKEAQDFFMQLKEEGADFEAQKIALQKWYNDDKGEKTQRDLLRLMEDNGGSF